MTNKTVKEWNSSVQQINDQPSHRLLSNDYFNQVDDPKGYLKHMVTTHVTYKFHDNDSPDHELILKSNDVCKLLRHFDQQNGFPNNARVRIVSITKQRIRVVSLKK